MNTRQNILKTTQSIFLVLLLIGLTVLTARPELNRMSNDKNQQEGHYPWRFVLADTTRDRFEQTCDDWSDKKYEVSRVCIELGNYDGPPGYTAILIRSLLVAGPGIRTEIMTTFPAGQYHLCLLELDGFHVYAYELEQRGSGVYITGLRVFSPNKLDGERIGPRGIYQYASCNPAGTLCLLVDDGISVYQFGSGFEARIENAQRIPECAASLTDMICGFSLSGEFMEMKWSTDTTGELIIRDEKHEIKQEININLEAILVD